MTTPTPKAPTSSVLRNLNGRPLRPRANTTHSESSVIASLEAARNPRNCRHTYSQEPSQVLRFFVQPADVEVADKKGSNCPQKNIKLPRVLKRAPFVDISRAALEAVDPELKGVPLESIHDAFKVLGPQLYTVASTSKGNIPGERLPRELDVVINDISSDAPTHLLAVHAKSATRVSLFPVHAIILAANCARLPAFPPSSSRTPAEAGSKITFPVTPFFIPDPDTFSIILYYLYTKRVDHLFSALLPLPLQGKTSIDELSRTYSSTFTVQALLSHANRVHGIWSNVAALGIFDERLSQVIEVAWKVLLTALAGSPGARWETVSTVQQL